MRIRLSWIVGSIALALAVSPLAAQIPAVSDIEAPYPAVQGPVHMAGVQYGSGTVSYGPVNTPLIMSGSNFGSSGTVLFPGTQAGTTVQASVSYWSSNILFLTVPTGATSGLVKVVTQGQTSVGVPFIVTQGIYSPSCPASPPTTQLEITTASLPNAPVGRAYSATLGAEGGTPPYSWSLIGGTQLPTGLSLAASTGAITGTPSVAGTASFTVQVTDSNAGVKSSALSIAVNAQMLVPGPVYSYQADPAGEGYDSVGNVTQFTDSVMGTWSFGYDYLNRLTSASPGNNQSICMAYDSFGNRTKSTALQSACSSADPATESYTAANRINWLTGTSGITEDASGDVTYDGKTNYVYDGEGRLCAVQYNGYSGGPVAIGYLYDADGRRVAKGTITANSLSCNPASNGFTLTESYVLDQGGEKLTALDQNGNWEQTNVYGGGMLLATYNTSGLHFHLTDPLGTRRVQTTAQGQPELDCQSLPFGDQQSCVADANAPLSPAPSDATNLHFTGKERDTESGNDYFGARYYASSMGRFLSPDWSEYPDTVPYADLTNPQSLNLYAYVGNNPLADADVDGHGCLDSDPCRAALDIGQGHRSAG